MTFIRYDLEKLVRPDHVLRNVNKYAAGQRAGPCGIEVCVSARGDGVC